MEKWQLDGRHFVFLQTKHFFINFILHTHAKFHQNRFVGSRNIANIRLHKKNGCQNGSHWFFSSKKLLLFAY